MPSGLPKFVVVNLDDLEKNFEAQATVTLDSLVEKGIVRISGRDEKLPLKVRRAQAGNCWMRWQQSVLCSDTISIQPCCPPLCCGWLCVGGSPQHLRQSRLAVGLHCSITQVLLHQPSCLRHCLTLSWVQRASNRLSVCLLMHTLTDEQPASSCSILAGCRWARGLLELVSRSQHVNASSCGCYSCAMPSIVQSFDAPCACTCSRAAHAAVQVLGTGELSKPLTIKAAAFSGSAMEKIAAAGGQAEQLAQKAKWTRKAYEKLVAEYAAEGKDYKAEQLKRKAAAKAKKAKKVAA
jgi:hypothetical protein